MDLIDLENRLKLPLGAVGLFAGIFFLIIGALTEFFEFETFLSEIGDYNWWIIIFSAFVSLFAGYYFADAIWRRRTFKKLVYTSKRSEFKKNEKEIQKLLKALPSSYRGAVEERKKELKIRE